MSEMVDKVIEMLDSMERSEVFAVYRYMERRKIWRKTQHDEGFAAVAGRYVEIMNEIIHSDVRIKSRKPSSVFGRYIIYFQLLSEGWASLLVGDYFNVDHSIVLYGKKRVRDILEVPMVYPEVIAMFNQFKAKIL